MNVSVPYTSRVIDTAGSQADVALVMRVLKTIYLAVLAQALSRMGRQ